MSSQDSTLLPPRERLVSWLARLYRHRLTTTTGGNLSLIDDDGILYITPSGGDKAIIPPLNVAVRKPGNDTFDGPKPPSMEYKLHTEVYKSRRSCRAILHAHSINLIAFSIVRVGTKCMSTSSDTAGSHPGVPDTRCLLSAWISCGRVAFVPYFPPGSDQLAKACADALKRANCAVLQNHGVVTIGKTMQEAFDLFVSLEYLAQTIINATSIGPPVPLKRSVLDLPTRILEPVELCPCVQCCCTRRTISGREKEIRSELCTFVKRAYDHNLFTSSSGSISIRVRDDDGNGNDDSAKVSFVISPTNVDRESLTVKDICYLSNATDCASEDCHMGCPGRTRRRGAAVRRGSCSFISKQKGTDQAMGAGLSNMRSSSCSKLVHGIRGKDANAHTNTTTMTKNSSWETSTTAVSGYHKFSPNCYFHKLNANDAPYHITRPSHTAEIHHSIYAMHPEINCIIIAQPLYTTSFCISGKSFNSAGIPESHLILGNVPSLPFESLQHKGISIAQALHPPTLPPSPPNHDNRTFTSSSSSMSTSPSPSPSSLVLVNNFGLISAGKSAIQTYVQVEVCESSCGVLLTAMRRGNPSLLNDTQVAEIDHLFHPATH